MISVPDLSTIELGSRFEAACGPVTTAQLVRYAGASGDFNPIHYDHHYAVGAKLGGVIAHGMLTMAFMCRALTDRAGPRGSVSRVTARFLAPVRPGDTVTTIVTVNSRREDTAQPGIDCDLAAFVGDRQVAEGKATIVWPDQEPARQDFGGIGERHA
jgi:acyl dehydratase